jgi:hypothetical protein
MVKNYALMLGENVLGCILGDFFINSSGHPGGGVRQDNTEMKNAFFPIFFIVFSPSRFPTQTNECGVKIR